MKKQKIITRACIDENNVINKNVLLQERIGTDSIYGRVYKSCTLSSSGKCNQHRAVKVIYSPEVVKYKKAPFLKKTLDRSSVYTEILLCKLVDFLYSKKLSPCLPGFFKYNACYKTSSVSIVSELANGDLKGLMQQITPPVETMISVYFEIFAALYVMKEFFGIEHDDLHWGNVLFKKTPVKKGNYRKYIISGSSFIVPDTGITPIIWDFGLSYIPGKIKQKIQKDETHRGEYEDYSRIVTMLIDSDKEINGIYDNMATSIYNTISEFIRNDIPPVKLVMRLGSMVNKILLDRSENVSSSDISRVYNCDKLVSTKDPVILKYINKKRLNKKQPSQR